VQSVNTITATQNDVVLISQSRDLYRKWIISACMRDSDEIPMSIPIFPIFSMLDIANIGKAVGISLLSRIKAEIYVISYLLPVSDRHLWFLTYPDKRQCLDQSSHVAWHRKHRYIAVGIISLSCVQARNLATIRRYEGYCIYLHFLFSFL